MNNAAAEQSAFARFLGMRRWRKLFDALRLESSRQQAPALGSSHVLVALLVTSIPVCIAALDALSHGELGTLPTISFGIATLLAIVLRKRFDLSFQSVRNWRNELSLTHTAFALGCIPAVLVVALHPTLLAERHDLVASAAADAAAGPATLMDILLACGLLLLIAAWAAVTEEFVFRGLLVSVIRRWKVLQSQQTRDILAAVVSAGVFGAAHYATWGFAASAALVGIGLGFAAAYIANQERIMTLVLYHFLFDVLSLTASLLI